MVKNAISAALAVLRRPAVLKVLVGLAAAAAATYAGPEVAGKVAEALNLLLAAFGLQ